jgi:hypothetical protein
VIRKQVCLVKEMRCEDNGPLSSFAQQNVPNLSAGERVDAAANLVHAANTTASGEHHAELQFSLLTARECL